MLPARHRLRESADFRAAGRGPGGFRAGGELLVLQASLPVQRASVGSLPVGSLAAVPAHAGPARVGLVVSRSVGGAVIRTRVKRRLRALAAARLSRLPQGAVLVLRARPAAAAATSAQLGTELDRHLDRWLRRVA